LEGEVPK